MGKHVDLRCSRRLTLQEARALVELVEVTKPTRGQFRGVGNAVKKLRAALLLAEHECKFSREGFCKICNRPRGFVPYNPVERLLKAAREVAERRQKLREDEKRRADIRDRQEALRHRVIKFPGGGAGA